MGVDMMMMVLIILSQNFLGAWLIIENLVLHYQVQIGALFVAVALHQIL